MPPTNLKKPKISRILAWFAASGRRSQDFLGARWITFLLDRLPEAKKRHWALRILALSPHYFLDGDDAAHDRMPHSEYLEAAFSINVNSRITIYDELLQQELRPDQTVLDYGCGPGFLARIVAPHVNKLYAADISAGAIACARILNCEPNISYLESIDLGSAIADGSVDLIYSFAVFQHLTDETMESVLKICWEKLAADGKLIAHIQLINDKWSSEASWRAKRSTYDKARFRYGLHCFGRSERQIRELFEHQQFAITEIRSIPSVFSYEVEDGEDQVIVYAKRKPGVEPMQKPTDRSSSS
jgi:cyclopropane fatty-acyl-phospholipid synthase-like methyltransferase